MAASALADGDADVEAITGRIRSLVQAQIEQAIAAARSS
jgi:hypothetical protein